MVFSNGTVHWRESWQSEECGGSRFRGDPDEDDNVEQA